MPLYEPPIQKCGSGHWLTDPCPKGVCDLLVFERDVPVYRKFGESADAEPPPELTSAEREKLKVSPAELEKRVEEATKRSALSAAEKQRRYRERKKARQTGE